MGKVTRIILAASKIEKGFEAMNGLYRYRRDFVLNPAKKLQKHLVGTFSFSVLAVILSVMMRFMASRERCVALLKAVEASQSSGITPTVLFRMSFVVLLVPHTLIADLVSREG